MPYRGRAIKKIKGQRRLKSATPTAKFTLTKVFHLQKGQASDNAYVLDIDVSTPFSPITARNGQWSSNDAVNEPFGLSSDLYSHYNHLIVKGCKVTVSVKDMPDAQPELGEDLTTGQVSLIRASQANAITGAITASQIKTLYGHVTRGFQLSTRQEGAGISNNVLTKNAYCSLGYSARKTWNANPLSVDDLRVANVSGSTNKPTDTTHINVVVLPQNDNLGTLYLQPVQVVVRLEYIISFMEPTRVQTVPLPISDADGDKGESWTQYGKRMYKYYAPYVKPYVKYAKPIAYKMARGYVQARHPQHRAIRY